MQFRNKKGVTDS